jgi:hypothetical protein
LQNGEKGLSRPFCLSVMYIAVVQRFTERPHISLLRARKFFLSEFLNFNGGCCQNFSASPVFFIAMIYTLFMGVCLLPNGYCEGWGIAVPLHRRFKEKGNKI